MSKPIRLYTRRDGRYYADFRPYADVGGAQEALCPPGTRRATTDPKVAQRLLANRLRELEAARRDRVMVGTARRATLAPYAAEHLRKKAVSRRVTDNWLEIHELVLRRAVDHFGADRPLHTIGVVDVAAWATALRTAGRRGLSDGSVRHHLNVLSNLYRRAQSEGAVPPGFNPVGAMLDKPVGQRLEARWLEVPEAAKLLETARTLPSSPERDALPAPLAYALLAAHLLTGGRSAEVRGLEVDDVSFERATVTFRPNAHRRLKTLTSARVVPLWPQLAEILRPYLMGGGDARVGLLFPSPAGGGMLKDWRKTLDRIGMRAGWDRGAIRTKMFRHTYCAARLQTLDGGAPVSPFTVSRELGHGSRAMVEQVYAHLGSVRHRAAVVEYRVEKLSERIGAGVSMVQGTPR